MFRPRCVMIACLILAVAAMLPGCGRIGFEVNVDAGSSDGARSFDGDSTSPVYECLSQDEIPEPECEALVDLFLATAGPRSWSNRTGWLASRSPCSWFGVSCSGGHVDALSFESNGLNGVLPGSIRDLSALTSLVIRATSSDWVRGVGCEDSTAWPNILNRLPPELSRISTLETLELTCASLVGGIPTEYGDFAALQRLDLSESSLTGAIPASLGAIPTLVHLDLNRNELTGPVPNKLGDLTNLETLCLESNLLTGTLPPELGSLPALEQFDLNDNMFSGAIPPQLEGLSSLVGLDLADNQLDGSLPVELGALSSVTNIRFANNMLAGVVPDVIRMLPELEILELTGNGCLTASDETATWLAARDPDWDDGCR